MGRRTIADTEVEGVQANPLPVLVVFGKVVPNAWSQPASKLAQAGQNVEAGTPPPNGPAFPPPFPLIEPKNKGQAPVGEECGA